MICFFNSARAWGGGEKWHYEMACALSKENIKVIAITSRGSDLQKKFAAARIPYREFPISNLSFLNPLLLIALRQFFLQYAVETVILNLPQDLKTGGIAARLAGVRRIIYRRGSAIPIRNTFLNRILFRKVVTEIIANSYATFHTILQKNPRLIDPARVTVIYNGIHINRLFPVPLIKPYRPDQPVIIGNLGRLEYQKAQHLLIELGDQLKQRGFSFKILIGGSGSLYHRLHREIQNRGLAEHIVLMGEIANVPEFLAGIDIFVLTSYWEGFGYVIAEAMAAAKPVVAFNHSSNPELIDDGTTGFLVRPADMHDLFEKVTKLMTDAELRISMGLAAREKAIKMFDFDQQYKKFKVLLLGNESAHTPGNPGNC